METFSNTEELDERTRKVIGSCLGTPVVLRQLLQNFSNKELIELSLVNKQWNYEARSVLRDRGTLTARIASGDHRRDLIAFASDLETMRVVPFSGIKVTLYHNLSRICRSASDESYKVILDRLRIKKLSIHFFLGWDKCTDCPLFLLVKTLLDNFSGLLETLSLTFDWDKVHTVQDCFTSRSLHRLKTLRLDAEDTDEDFTRFVKALVSRAPHLQKLQMGEEICLDENVLEGSSAVLVPLPNFNPLYERVCEDLIPALKPETIKIYQRRYRESFNAEILSRFLPKVLQVSVNTLHTLKMDLIFAVPLMCYGVCLENVTALEIRLDVDGIENLEPRLLTLLKRFDFTRIFPKLEKVEIQNVCDQVFSADTIDAFVEQGNALLRTENLQDRAINIKQLTLRYPTLDSTIPLLAQMFPNVKTLSVETRDYNCPTPFTALWDHFRFLQELKFKNSQRWNEIKNLDSVFCGIFPEEVAELRAKDDNYLKAVNIVPVMPSITCMKNLRTFSFRYTPERYMPGRDIDRPFFWFSKVTGFIGFARCPSLDVIFQTRSWQDAEALSHVERFGTFVSLDD